MEVRFFLRGKNAARANERCVIYAQIEVEGFKRGTAFSTQLKVLAQDWQADDEESPVKKRYYRSAEINAKLREMRSTLADYVTALAVMGDECSPKRLKELWDKGGFMPKKIPTFLAVYDELVKSKKTKGREESTLTTYETRRKNLVRFLRARYSEDLLISQVKYRHCDELELWMKGQRDADDKPKFGRNNINKHLTVVKQVLDYAVNREYIQNNPIGRLFLEYDKAKPPVYLLPNDRKTIIECGVRTLEKEKDVAVFLFSTGLSYTDYLSLDESHLLRVPSGEMFIKKQRDKSEVYSIVPLLRDAHNVILKYGSVANLPRPDISDLNKSLKVLAEVSGIGHGLKTSDFRDTFACMMENEYMIEKRTLMYMMGHTNERQLNNYSAVMPARILFELRKQQPNPKTISLEIFNELVTHVA